MPRTQRPVLPGCPLHVVQRGNDRTTTFRDDHDFRVYRDVLRTVSLRAEVEIHAYVLMRNHVHLLLTPRRREGPARMFRSLGTVYVRYFNERHARTGTLWDGRFRSTLVDSERYFLACSRYIELNPVRAGVVQRPGDYRWSSFRHHTGETTDPILTAHPVYLALDRDADRRRIAYRHLFDSELESAQMELIRRRTRSGMPLGDENYYRSIVRQLGRPLRRVPARRRPSAPAGTE